MAAIAGAVLASVAGAATSSLLAGGSGGGGAGGGGAGSAALAEMARQQARTADFAFVGDTTRPFSGDPEDPVRELSDRALAALTNLDPEGNPEAALKVIAAKMADEATKDQQIGVQDQPMVTAQAPEAPKVTAAPSVEGTEYKVIEQEEEEEEKEIPIPEKGSFLA